MTYYIFILGQMCMILYSSEPFWSGDALIAIALLIGIVLGACLPAAVCFRAGEKGTGAGCLALGLLGTFLYIPWIIAVVIAAKRVSFQEREETAAFRNVGRILGILLLLGLLFCSLRLTALSVRRQRDAGNRFRLLPGLLFVIGALTPRFYAEHDLFDIIRYHAYDDVVLVALLVWSACWYVVQLVRLSLPTREQAPTAAKLP